MHLPIFFPHQVSHERYITMQTELFKITGMTCGGCVISVTKALKAVSGVGDAKISLSTGEATVQFDEGMTSPDRLKFAVLQAGYGINATISAAGPKSRGGCC